MRRNEPESTISIIRESIDFDGQAFFELLNNNFSLQTTPQNSFSPPPLFNNQNIINKKNDLKDLEKKDIEKSSSDERSHKVDFKILSDSLHEETFSQSSDNSPIKIIEEDNDENTLLIKKSFLKLVNVESNQEFKIRSSVIIGRKQGSDSNYITISGQEISKEHCKINSFGKGYTIKDNKSMNGTFIKIKKDYTTIVYNGMVLKIGDFFLEINLNLRGKSIKYNLYEEEEEKKECETKICLFKDNTKIFFGKNPGGENDIKINDPQIDDVHGYFEKNLTAFFM